MQSGGAFEFKKSEVRHRGSLISCTSGFMGRAVKHLSEGFVRQREKVREKKKKKKKQPYTLYPRLCNLNPKLKPHTSGISLRFLGIPDFDPPKCRGPKP